MTKEQLQKELQEKVKEGVKPSDLKKLKRSKSADDLPNSSSPDLKTENTELKKELEISSKTIKELTKVASEKVLFEEQLKEKQKEVESLREQLENQPTPPELTELDNSLLARHQSLKDWFSQYEKNQKLEKELAENVDYAFKELDQQDDLISELRTKNRQLRQQKQSLERDLELAERLAELRKSPLPEYSNDYDFSYLQFTLYALMAVVFGWWLIGNDKQNN